MVLKKNWAEKFRDWLNHNPFVVLLAVCVILISSFFTIFDGGKRIVDFYVRNFKWQIIEEKKINSLSASISIENFINILGTPLFKREPSYVKKEYEEYTFKGRGYWVQAITDRMGSVVLYAVTACDDNFRPIIYNSPLSKNIVLRVSNFEVGDGNSIGYYFRGVTANSYAFEESYLANPGNYQTVFYGLNDICINDADELSALPFGCGYDEEVECPQGEMKEFRVNHYINTFAVSAPFISAENLFSAAEYAGLQIGVDRVLVRVYPTN